MMGTKTDYFPEEQDPVIKRFKAQALQTIASTRIQDAEHGEISSKRVHGAELGDFHGYITFKQDCLVPLVDAVFSGDKEQIDRSKFKVSDRAARAIAPDDFVAESLKAACQRYAEQVTQTMQEYAAKVPGQGVARGVA